MIEQASKNLCSIKTEFVKNHDRGGNVWEVIPAQQSNELFIEEKFLKMLHLFASKNPIYYESYEKDIAGRKYTAYEGDINRYWLNSISHDASHAPFSPTWIVSAFIAVLQAKEFGFNEIVDIGSGDGRIAYCAKVLGLDTYSVEIDQQLVELQKTISKETSVDFRPHCKDAVIMDLEQLKLERPVFFIGGLAQMGGTILACSIIEKITNLNLKQNVGFVFAGTHSRKYANSEYTAGWGNLIKDNSLKVIKMLSLPTAWTFRESKDTPYIFAKFV